jgi:hypothetical protein
MVQMGWNQSSPTNALRVSLLAYLRARKSQLENPAKIYASPWWEYDGLVIAADIANLRRWIAWLEGTEVSISTSDKEIP